MSVSQTNYYPALTGLRALAAFMVFFHHANPFNATGWQRPFFLFVNELHTGVSLFFVLSGFLIYSRYSHSSSTKLSTYLRNRFVRIYPLYFIVLIPVIIITIYRDDQLSGKSYFTYVTNFTLSQGFFDELKFTGIAQAWSLTVEECFYLFLPIVLFRNEKHRFLLFPILLLLTGILLVLLFQRADFYGFFSSFRFMLEYTFFGRCVEFFLGIAIAVYMNKQRRAVSNFSITYTALLVWITTIVSIVFFSNTLAGQLINNFIVPWAVALLIVGLIREPTSLQKILSTGLFQLLGKSSYAFYLLHAGYLYAFLYHYVSTQVMVIFVLINIIAVATYNLIERPIYERWRLPHA